MSLVLLLGHGFSFRIKLFTIFLYFFLKDNQKCSHKVGLEEKKRKCEKTKQ